MAQRSYPFCAALVAASGLLCLLFAAGVSAEPVAEPSSPTHLALEATQAICTALVRGNALWFRAVTINSPVRRSYEAHLDGLQQLAPEGRRQNIPTDDAAWGAASARWAAVFKGDNSFIGRPQVEPLAIAITVHFEKGDLTTHWRFHFTVRNRRRPPQTQETLRHQCCSSRKGSGFFRVEKT